MANEWHYTKNGERFGPVSGQQLKELAARGEIGSADLVWKEEMKEWLPASKVKGLLPTPTACVIEQQPVPPGADMDKGQPPVERPSSILAKLKTTADSAARAAHSAATSDKTKAMIGRAKSIWGTLSIKQRLIVGGGAVGLSLILLFGVMSLFPTSSSVTTYELAAAYSSSEAKANSRFKGQVIQVSGIISAPGSRTLPDGNGGFYEIASVIFKTNTPIRVRCDFKDSNITYDQAAASVGSFVALKGECRGLEKYGSRFNKGADVWLKDCEVVLVSGTGNVADDRNNNVGDVAGKRNQALDEIIAKRNARLGKPSTPVDTYSGTGGGDEAIYKRGYDEGYALGNEYARRLASMDAVTKRDFTQTFQQELQGHEATLRQITQAFGTDHPQVMAKMGFCNGLRTALAQAK